MPAVEILRTSLGELRARPLRSGLTLAGFAVSMAIATVLLSAGSGLERTVADVLRSLGEGQIVATPGRTTGVGGVQRSGRPVQLRFKDVESIREALPSFEGIASYFDLRGGGASSWRYSVPWSPVRAVSVEYASVRQLPLAEGRWFTREESERGEWVTVLNQGLRRMIFRDHDAVGEWVEWRGRRMEVVGVVRDEALFPYILFLPYRTVSQNMADARWISGIVARPGPGFDWERGERELRRALAGIGEFDPSDENAVEIETNEEFAEQVRRATLAFRILVLTIASVSLLLGGLGVAHMMVISVEERTREIGLRQALGATPLHIFSQVLVEALVIAAIGGGLGLAAGLTACRVASPIPISSEQSIDLALDLAGSASAFVALGAAAVIAGLIPARRAAALTPAEALRWE